MKRMIIWFTVALSLSAAGANQHRLDPIASASAISSEALHWHSEDTIHEVTSSQRPEFFLTPSNDDITTQLPQTNGVLDIAKTLTRVVSKVVSELGLLSDVMSGVRLVASFFKTTYLTETNEHYWEELCETAQAMVDETIDDTIIQQTNDAVTRLSENLELYLRTNSTEGELSILQLSILIDVELNNILSLYAGIHHVEVIVLHYLDMATTRLSLWQATSLRYIDEYTIEGNLLSSGSVCDIVTKWDLAFKTETEEIVTKLTPALSTWMNDYRNNLSMSCQVDYEHPAFKEWRRIAYCKIFDGYHGKFLEDWKNRCHERTDPKCPALEFICFNYCNYARLYPHIGHNDDNYHTFIDLINTMTSNFMVVQKTQLDYYKEQCGLLE